MLGGRVVRDEIDEDSKAEVVRVADEQIEVSQRAEPRVDVAVVPHVVAPVGLR